MLGNYRNAIIALGLIVATQVGARIPNDTGAPESNSSFDHRMIPSHQDASSAMRQPTDAGKREQADLEAQWMAAKAAKRQAYLARWQTGIAGFATVVAALGTVLLIRTFHETRQAAIAAARSAEQAENNNELTLALFLAGQRPWVKLDHERPSKVTLLQNKIQLTIPITIENIGKNPAVDIQAHVKIIDIRSGEYGVEETVKDLARQTTRGFSGIWKESPILPGTKSDIHRILDYDIRDHGPVGATADVTVDYVVVVRYSQPGDKIEYGAAVAYTASFRSIPTLAMFLEDIAEHHWTASRITGGAYVT